MYCVYCHTNKANGKKYIGITCQAVERRWRNGLGYKTGAFFNAIKKYGWDGFEHEILLEGLTEEQAKLKEVEFIAQYKTRSKRYGYNETDGGEGTSGYKRSDAERAAMSSSRKGRHAGSKNPMYGKTGKQAPHYGVPVSTEAKAVIASKIIAAHKQGRYSSQYRAVLAVKGDSKIKFDSIAEAAAAIGIHATNITRVCKGKRKTAGGYEWQYA